MLDITCDCELSSEIAINFGNIAKNVIRFVGNNAGIIATVGGLAVGAGLIYKAGQRKGREEERKRIEEQRKEQQLQPYVHTQPPQPPQQVYQTQQTPAYTQTTQTQLVQTQQNQPAQPAKKFNWLWIIVPVIAIIAIAGYYFFIMKKK